MREGQKTFTARRLRRDETFAEKRLWEQLRNRALDRCKFVRQAPVGPFIADFLCREMKLIVEVDGATHSTLEEITRDHSRTDALKKLGYSVLRFQNDDVINGMDDVLGLIHGVLTLCPSPPPAQYAGSPSSPAGGRGPKENHS
ncbi:endonuclease domain-containing protein [Aestuariivirga sp.]|uniref:endonuclease domain-containing protein n=1 Tax=Aestuariivirga sp. TaxID=2650926 RepID=UPI003593193E